MCNAPWNPKILRAATLVPDLPNASTALFLKLVSIRAFMVVLLIAIAAFFGVRARKDAGGGVSITNEELLAQFKDTELTRHKNFVWNLLLTAFMIFCLIVFEKAPQYDVFALGLVVALALNFPTSRSRTGCSRSTRCRCSRCARPCSSPA